MPAGGGGGGGVNIFRGVEVPTKKSKDTRHLLTRWIQEGFTVEPL